MAKLTDEEVKHVAKLAQLELEDTEIKEYKEQLSEVLEYIEQLQEVDTSNVEPTAQTTGLTNVFREDEVDPTRTLSNEEALSNAKRTHNGFIVVDHILKNKDE